jgi:hypothetical protein
MTEEQKLAIIGMAESCELFMSFASGQKMADSEDFIAADRHSAALFSEEAFRIAQSAEA